MRESLILTNYYRTNLTFTFKLIFYVLASITSKSRAPPKCRLLIISKNILSYKSYLSLNFSDRFTRLKKDSVQSIFFSLVVTNYN